MDNKRPDFLSLRNIKRSQSVLVNVSTKNNETNSVSPMFPFHERKMHNPASLCELGHCERNHPSIELLREKSVIYEGSSELSRQKKLKFSCRHYTFLFLIVFGILGTSVIVSYFIATLYKPCHSESLTSAKRNIVTESAISVVSSNPGKLVLETKPIPEIEMAFDSTCSNDGSEILKWRHVENAIGFTEGLEYDKGYFILPRAGMYRIHMALSIDVSYITVNKSDTLVLSICVSRYRGRVDPIRCVKSRVSYNWAGQIVIGIPRMFFDKKEILVTTITSNRKDLKNVKEVIKPDPTESHLQIYHV